ncbi:MAG: phosphoribosylaminoimidazolesuccinocarboxamide synthase [Nitrospiraceae bacterium]|nr:MAG: phosphoribosylaminoimidazolesuccinocarboxamide synthase [Nitrospiraceae bacterium]
MSSVFDRPVVLETRLEGLQLKGRGKVRDIYDLGDSLLIVATDRISAFDVVLPNGIPGKGAVLTQLSAFWFHWLSDYEDILWNHFITADVVDFPPSCHQHRSVLEGRSMLVRKATPFPVECIVRGYLSGSGWADYQRSGEICGQALPKGLVESQKLPTPLFTPSTKAEGGAHDMNIPFTAMELLIGSNTAKLVREVSLKVYQRASEYAESKGIIIADTKMEFGLDPSSGQPMLIDEVLTPDSSRFWPRSEYVQGRAQPSFDKQFVRDYLTSIKWDKTPPAPALPDEVVRQTSARYREAYRMLTGT